MTQEFPKAVYHPDSKAMEIVYTADQERDVLVGWGVEVPSAEEPASTEPEAIAPAAETPAGEITENNV